MQLTDRDVSVLELLLTFGYLITSQIRSIVFPNDKDGSVTRDRLRKMEAAGLVQRRRAEVANPLTSNTIPVWIITEQGICQLSLRNNDTTILNQKPPCTRSWQNFTHYVAVADLMLKRPLDLAGWISPAHPGDHRQAGWESVRVRHARPFDSSQQVSFGGCRFTRRLERQDTACPGTLAVPFRSAARDLGFPFSRRGANTNQRAIP